MVEMVKENVHRIVEPHMVNELIERGFIVIEPVNSGGEAIVSPPAPDRYDEKIEPVQINIEKPDAHKLGNRYWNQLNKSELKQLFDREGITYKETDTIPEMRNIYKRYIDSLRKNRR